MAPRYVKPYVKHRKNDRADAEAIREAAEHARQSGQERGAAEHPGDPPGTRDAGRSEADQRDGLPSCGTAVPDAEAVRLITLTPDRNNRLRRCPSGNPTHRQLDDAVQEIETPSSPGLR